MILSNSGRITIVRPRPSQEWLGFGFRWEDIIGRCVFVYRKVGCKLRLSRILYDSSKTTYVTNRTDDNPASKASRPEKSF